MLTFEQIVEVVCDYLNVNKEKVFDRNQKAEIVYARQICMVMLQKYTKAGLKTIGEYCGKRHHSTVINAKDKINGLCDVDERDRFTINEIHSLIRELEHPVEMAV